MSRVLVLGGYGNAGSQVVELLLASSDCSIIVAGRNADHGTRFVAELGERIPGSGARLSAIAVDAADRAALTAALRDVDLLIAASSTTRYVVQTVEACLATGCDYIDMQLGTAKVAAIRARNARALRAGVMLVTDGGFHPGLPAAMVRHTQQRLPFLTTALIGSVIAMDWGALRPLARSTVDELTAEFRDFRYEEYRAGSWVKARGSRGFLFPAPFGRRKCAAMGLVEMHELIATAPHLRDAGFYVGGFNPVVDRLIMPIGWVGMRTFPHLTERPLGTVLERALIRYSKPPFGTILQLDGSQAGEEVRPLLRVSHPDAYTLTAAPVVAAVLQMLDPATRRPGVHLQATMVEPTRFFADLAQLGVAVEQLSTSGHRELG